jgi:hypothetical protein
VRRACGWTCEKCQNKNFNEGSVNGVSYGGDIGEDFDAEEEDDDLLVELSGICKYDVTFYSILSGWAGFW